MKGCFTYKRLVLIATFLFAPILSHSQKCRWTLLDEIPDYSLKIYLVDSLPGQDRFALTFHTESGRDTLYYQPLEEKYYYPEHLSVYAVQVTGSGMKEILLHWESEQPIAQDYYESGADRKIINKVLDLETGKELFSAVEYEYKMDSFQPWYDNDVGNYYRNEYLTQYDFRMHPSGRIVIGNQQSKCTREKTKLEWVKSKGKKSKKRTTTIDTCEVRFDHLPGVYEFKDGSYQLVSYPGGDQPAENVHQLHLNYNGFNRNAKKQAAVITLDGEVYDCTIDEHGNSTRLAPKKSYDIEMKDENGQDKYAQLFDFPLGEDFVLLANYYDPAFVRNSLAFYLWEQLGHVSPKTAFCNLYLGDEYQGLYLLTEKITGEFRRQELMTPFTAGELNFHNYALLLKYDRENQGWTRGLKAMDGGEIWCRVLYPKHVNNRSDTTIERYLRTVSESIENENSGYAELISSESFVDYFLLNELAKNPDAFISSVYLFKDVSGKLNMGPIWDFDLAFANPLNPEDDDPEGWMYEEQLRRGNTGTMPAWWYELLCKKEFKEQCLERLNVFEQLLNTDSLAAFFKEQYTVIGNAYEVNRKHWADSLDSPAEVKNLEHDLWEHSADEITSFLSRRLRWVKDNLSSAPCGTVFGVLHQLQGHDRIVADSKDSVFVVDFGTRLYSGMASADDRYNYSSSFIFTIYDNTGKEIKSGPLEEGDGVTLSCAGWKKGTYYLLVSEHETGSMLSYSAALPFYMNWFELVIE